MEKEIATTLLNIPLYENEVTDDPHLSRVVDRNGDWTHYYQDEVQKYLPAVNHIIALGFPKGQGLIHWLKKMTEEEADKALASAGERGSKVHAAIRDLISGQTVTYGLSSYRNDDGQLATLTSDEWDYLMAWVAWAQMFKPQVLKHETSVWHKKNFYAGTIDFIGKITIPKDCKVYVNGKLTTFANEATLSCLLDWKTSSAIYDDYKLQTSAYAACIKQSPKLPFFTGVVRIGTKHKNGGYEMHLWDRGATLKHLKLFLNAKTNYHFITGGKEWQPDLSTIPAILNVAVPQISPIKTIKKKANANSRTNQQREAAPKRQLQH